MKRNFLPILAIVVSVLAIYVSSRSLVKPAMPSSTTNVVENIRAVNQATGWVTTNADGLVIVHDGGRGARFSFVPAKAGTNDGGVTSGPTSK